MPENTENQSIKSVRDELKSLDSQIESAKALRRILAEEKKPIYSVYKWESPERVFEKKDKKWYLAVSTFSMFIVVLSLLTENYGLVVAVIALIILLYALNSVPPQNASHEITNKGISLNSFLYSWKKINKFWISRRGKHSYLNLLVEVKNNEEDQIITYLGDADVKKIVSELSQYIDYLAETEINNNFLNRNLFGSVEPLSKYIG